MLVTPLIERMKLYGNDAIIPLLVLDFKGSEAMIGLIDRLFQLLIVILFDSCYCILQPKSYFCMLSLFLFVSANHRFKLRINPCVELNYNQWISVGGGR